MEATKRWLNHLKVRGSYGTLGNQPASNYPYQAQMTSGTAGYLIDGQYVSSVGAPNLVSPTLTWEKATNVDIGVDALFLNNRLDFSFDWYRRVTSDILTDGSVAYPSVLGATAPLENSGELESKGWEFSIKWSDRLLGSDLRYDVTALLSDTRTTVLHYAANPEKFIARLYDGASVGDIWGYETGGIVQESDGEWSADGTKWTLTNPNIPRFNGTEVLYPGYLWRQNINGDTNDDGSQKLTEGVGTVDDPGDRKIIGNSLARYRYGLTANLYYKGFDLNIFFQGVGKRDVWISDANYWGGNAGSLLAYERAWRPSTDANPRTDAAFPMYGAGTPAVQSGYIVNGAYLRLKQLVLGYTLPQSLTKKAHIEKLRVNVSAYNLFEITDVPDIYDPEQISSAYPAKRTLALGVQIGF
jgi:hypothetical protein